MTSKEVTELLGISRMTLSNYVSSGKILIKQKVNDRKIIYDDDSVYKLLNGAIDGNKVVIYYSGTKLEAKLDNSIMKKLLDFIRDQLVS